MRSIFFTGGTGRTHVFQNILSLSGFDAASVRHVYTAYAGQDGASYQESFVDPRPLEITFDIKAEPRKSLEEQMRDITMKLSPKLGQGVIHYEIDGFAAEIKAVPEPPVFTRRSAQLATCKARFYAFDPYFADCTEVTASLKFVQKLLIFPVTFPTVFGELVNGGDFDNPGDAPAPVTIRFFGGVTTPIFENETTGEYIKVTGVIPEDSILEINTAPGVKSVALITDGIRTNAFSLLDPESSLWLLQPGVNRLQFTAAAEGEGSSGEIVFRHRYLGVPV